MSNTILPLDQLNTIMTPVKTKLTTLEDDMKTMPGVATLVHTGSSTQHNLSALDYLKYTTHLIPIVFIATADFKSGAKFKVDQKNAPMLPLLTAKVSGGDAPDNTFVTGDVVSAVIDTDNYTINFKSASKGGDDTPFKLYDYENQVYMRSTDELHVGECAYYGYQFEDVVTPIKTGFTGLCHVVVCDASHFLAVNSTEVSDSVFAATLKLYEISGTSLVEKATYNTGNTSGYLYDQSLYKISATQYILIENQNETAYTSRNITVDTTNWTMSVSGKTTIVSTYRPGRVLQFPGTPAQFYMAYYTASATVQVSIRTVSTSGSWTTNSSWTSHSTVTNMTRWTNMDCITSRGFGFIGAENNSSKRLDIGYKVDLRTATNSAPSAVADTYITANSPYTESRKFSWCLLNSTRVCKIYPMENEIEIYTVGTSGTGRPTIGGRIKLPQGCHTTNVQYVEDGWLLVHATANTAYEYEDTTTKDDLQNMVFFINWTASENYLYPQQVRYGYPTLLGGIGKLATRKYIFYTSYFTDYISGRDETSTNNYDAVDKRLTVVQLKNKLVSAYGYSEAGSGYVTKRLTMPVNCAVISEDSPFDGTRGYYTTTAIFPDYYTNKNSSFLVVTT